jgi:hypothetical protein
MGHLRHVHTEAAILEILTWKQLHPGETCMSGAHKRQARVQHLFASARSLPLVVLRLSHPCARALHPTEPF